MTPTPTQSATEAMARAIVLAEDRNGWIQSFDYSSYGAAEPFVIRDVSISGDLDQTLWSGTDQEACRAAYSSIKLHRLAQAALTALCALHPGIGAVLDGGAVVVAPEQIKRMVERFLSWTLPENFFPDGGIAFEPICNKGTAHEFARRPVGTNLFTAEQAEVMVRHMLAASPFVGGSKA